MSLILQVRKTETRQTPAGNPETTCFLRARAGAGIFVSRGLDVSTVSLLELLCRDVITNQEICLIFFSFFLMYAFSTLLLSSYYCSRERTKKIKTINHSLKGRFCGDVDQTRISPTYATWRRELVFTAAL